VPQEVEVAPAIVLLAERGQALHQPFDLVALSTHGEGGWDRWILGGVTEQVLWGTTLPVLVVRPSTLANPEQRAPDSLSFARS
jgi:nucleotide-binding universal stress UspA family protein